MDEENEEKERAIQRAADIILRDLKRLYDNAIQPLETMYKYRDLSNRHFGGERTGGDERTLLLLIARERELILYNLGVEVANCLTELTVR